jgi:hypothetical protein
MTSTIVLLEEQKEITTFLLDDGVKTLVDNVITSVGSNIGFEYSTNVWLMIYFVFPINQQ